jgi:hypothetical protein
MGPGAGPEFEDEEPGSYLSELGVGAGTVMWGALNLLVILGCGLLFAPRVGPDSQWRSLLDLTRMLAPVSAVLHFIVTLWQAGLGSAAGKSAAKTQASSRKLLVASFILAVASLGSWLFVG